MEFAEKEKCFVCFLQKLGKDKQPKGVKFKVIEEITKNIKRG